MADEMNIKKMKVAELKKQLTLHGLETKGNKGELQERLQEFLQQQGLELEHNGDAGDEEVEDDLEHTTEIGDDVLAEESLEQKSSMDKVKSLDDSDNKASPSEAIQTEEAVKSPTMKTENIKTFVTKPTTEEERKMQRIKRFGGPMKEEDKKLARAQRFGSNITSVSQEPADLAKLKKRAERFGEVSPLVTKNKDQDRLLKRKERFGASLVTTDNDSIEAKKKKRAERFST